MTNGNGERLSMSVAKRPARRKAGRTARERVNQEVMAGKETTASRAPIHCLGGLRAKKARKIRRTWSALGLDRKKR